MKTLLTQEICRRELARLLGADRWEVEARWLHSWEMPDGWDGKQIVWAFRYGKKIVHVAFYKRDLKLKLDTFSSVFLAPVATLFKDQTIGIGGGALPKWTDSDDTEWGR